MMKCAPDLKGKFLRKRQKLSRKNIAFTIIQRFQQKQDVVSKNSLSILLKVCITFIRVTYQTLKKSQNPTHRKVRIFFLILLGKTGLSSLANAKNAEGFLRGKNASNQWAEKTGGT
jgi:hypothetical protein